jgi:coenzyme F420-reducing hydrogenase gamma subunit
MSVNPMHEARTALATHPRCGAHCRTTGQPCRNPVIANGRCWMHGGKSSGAPRGPRHRFRHRKNDAKSAARRG